jgi:hypothetical protein
LYLLCSMWCLVTFVVCWCFVVLVVLTIPIVCYLVFISLLSKLLVLCMSYYFLYNGTMNCYCLYLLFVLLISSSFHKDYLNYLSCIMFEWCLLSVAELALKTEMWVKCCKKMIEFVLGERYLSIVMLVVSWI